MHLNLLLRLLHSLIQLIYCHGEKNYILFSDDSPPLDIKFRKILENHLSKLDHTRNLVTVTPSRIEAMIQLLNSRKAPGSDGLQPKHLIHGTPKLFEHLTVLFQALVAQQYVLDALCECIVTCVQ